MLLDSGLAVQCHAGERGLGCTWPRIIIARCVIMRGCCSSTWAAAVCSFSLVTKYRAESSGGEELEAHAEGRWKMLENSSTENLDFIRRLPMGTFLEIYIAN